MNDTNDFDLFDLEDDDDIFSQGAWDVNFWEFKLMEQLYILIIILEIFSSIFFFALRSVNFIKGPPFVLTCIDGEKIIAIKNLSDGSGTRNLGFGSAADKCV